MPDSLVFGRILPATGLMLFLSTVYYAWLAYRWRRRPAAPMSAPCRRASACRTCSSSPSWSCCRSSATKDPDPGLGGGPHLGVRAELRADDRRLHRPVIRRITPRAALLGSLAGISITFISMRPGLQMFETPVIGIVCFAIILANWFGGVRYFQGVPGGLVAIAVGTIIAWGSNIFGLGYGGLSVGAVGDAFSHFGFSFPDPGGRSRLFRLQVPRRHPGHRDSVRHLRPRRGDGQRRERRRGGRFVSDHAGADRRRRHQPDRLPDGQSVHQRRLHRPSRLEGDGRPDRLFRRDRRDGAGADLARHRRADAA
jgi:hypothetical protein